MFAGQPATPIVGDPFLQRSPKSFLFGFTSGPGKPDRINEAYSSGLEHTTLQVLQPTNEPPIGFQLLIGSYFGDRNCRRTDPPPYGAQDNFLRATTATISYGLAAMWAYASDWRLEPLASGESLGAAMLYTHGESLTNTYNTVTPAIIGDPTLRLHTLAPPTSLTATTNQSAVTLQWNASEPGTQYYVYLSTTSIYGPYPRISPDTPISGTNHTQSPAPAGQKFYMVRALLTATGGSGSYTNLSQGALVTVN